MAVEQTLTAFLKNHTQAEAAALLGVYQASVSKMVARGRDIRLVFDDHGQFQRYYELKIKKSA